MKKILYSALGAVAIGAAALSLALAQVIVIPNIAQHSASDTIQVVPNGQPSAASQYEPWNGVTNVYGYYKNGTGTTNLTLTTGANISYVHFGNASAIAYLYLYLPAAPLDGAKNCYFSIGAVTAMTLYANTGQTLNNAITAMSANTQYCYLYGASNTTFDRIQ